MRNLKLRIRKITWKKKQCLLLTYIIMFILLQFCTVSLLELLFANESSSGINTNVARRQNVAIKKVLSKWEEPQHSKLLKDPQGHAISLRGTRDLDIMKYFPNTRGKFACFSTKVEIDFLKVNDDYCDCPLDGSDEPGTNACNNGIFYCEKTSKNSKVKIPSYQVNDGICDCCDGSDEWQEVSVLDASDVSENRPLKYRLTHCENICSKNVH